MTYRLEVRRKKKDREAPIYSAIMSDEHIKDQKFMIRLGKNDSLSIIIKKEGEK